MTYSDKTWRAFDAADRTLVPRLARRYAMGDRRLTHRLLDAGRRRLLDCLVGVEQKAGGTDRYDEAAGRPFATYAYPRLRTAMRDTATRTRDGVGYGPAAARQLYGEP